MSICYLNGKFIDESQAVVSINDSGYYFGDGIYEVILLYKGKLIEKDAHLDRLMKCLDKVYFKNVPSKEEIFNNIINLLERNKDINTGSIYMQFTRGTAIRSHSFLELDLKPNFLIKIIPCKINKDIKKWSCKLIEDPRRMRCDIKMTSLLPMVLAHYESEKEGFDDVMFYNSRVASITEGSSFNIFIVDKNDKIITCPVGNAILSGCTRARIIKLCEENNLFVEERFYSKEELFNAKEVFVSGAIKLIVSVIKIDNNTIGNGDVGNITKLISDKMFNFIEQ